MKKNFFLRQLRQLIIIFAIFLQNVNFFPQTLQSESFINWNTNVFSSTINLQEQLATPSSRGEGENRIQQNLLPLLQFPILSIRVDSSRKIEDLIKWNTLSINEIAELVQNGAKTPAVYSLNQNALTIQHKINVIDIASKLIKHKVAYSPQIPIDRASSKKYTGIIIDARGELPVHGEFIQDSANACLFPKIWTNSMELLFEANMIEPTTLKNEGAVTYMSSLTNSKDLQNRVGNDPLYVLATEIFGIYRTDPVISNSNALKILSIPENRDLLTQGKVIILLNEKALSYQIKAPIKEKEYYKAYKKIHQYVFDHQIDDIKVEDSIKGILISVRNLKFKADSAELLPEEQQRLDELTKSLIASTLNANNKILVEGHTASVGKPYGEKQLSIARAKTIVDELVRRGIQRNLFTYNGYGGTMPIGDNNTAEGRAQNRRVEITITPKTVYIQRID